MLASLKQFKVNDPGGLNIHTCIALASQETFQYFFVSQFIGSDKIFWVPQSFTQSEKVSCCITTCRHIGTFNVLVED